MIELLLSRGFVGSLLRTTLIGYGLLSVLAKAEEALSFGDSAYFAGCLAVVVIATLSDRVDYRRGARPSGAAVERTAEQGPAGSAGP